MCEEASEQRMEEVSKQKKRGRKERRQYGAKTLTMQLLFFFLVCLDEMLETHNHLLEKNHKIFPLSCFKVNGNLPEFH